MFSINVFIIIASDNMDKTVKSLLRLSLTFRNIKFLPNHATSERLMKTTAVCYINNRESQEYTATDSAYRTPDQLIRNIQYSKNSNDVLALIANHYRTMNVQHVRTAADFLLNYYKHDYDAIEKIRNTKEFSLLCEALKRNIRSLSTSETIEMLKFLSFFKVPSNSVVFNMLLVIVKDLINRLSMWDLIFLHFLLGQIQETPLIQGIKIALPIVFDINVPTKLDRQNVNELASSLRFLCTTAKNSKTIEFLLDNVKNKPLNVKAAIDLYIALYSLEYLPEKYIPLLTSSQNIIAKELKKPTIGTIANLLHLMLDKRTERQPVFYHEGVIDACAAAVITNGMSFVQGARILCILNYLHHTHIQLLDYLATKCFEDPNLLTTCAPKMVESFVQGLSMADYKPIFWENIQSAIISSRIFERIEKMDCDLTRFAVNLLCLDCFLPELLDKIFRPSNGELKVNKDIVLLYQAVRALYPMYGGQWFSIDLSNSEGIHYHKSWFIMQDTLEQALGGRQYVLTAMRTKLGHFIDHAIVMRKGGYPVAVNTLSETCSGTTNTLLNQCIEDIQIPLGSQVILILYLSGGAYSTNTSNLHGGWSLMIRSIEAWSGHKVVIVRSQLWKDLPAQERIPYIMQAIKLKCDNETSLAHG
ncbi:uncharacterized protein LOC105695254 isoform X2 [Orussus abietinus]|uniref:uncharacterized protein LOC105695254 isoform X2 n=1 Tax=Orussus abietinus TaxID=222816 RepID=UPI000626808A|nr:uncharacterized protein LOC105695254 isoform X2 [Orussus abietinus]